MVSTTMERVMDYYDQHPTPSEFLHFDLMAGEVSEGFMPTTSIARSF